MVYKKLIHCNFRNPELAYHPKILVILALVTNSSNNTFTLCTSNKAILFIKSKPYRYIDIKCKPIRYTPSV